jgi:hypothetical protein
MVGTERSSFKLNSRKGFFSAHLALRTGGLFAQAVQFALKKQIHKRGAFS